MSAEIQRTSTREPRKIFLRHIVRKIFFEDWALKLTALVITLGLWFGVTGLSKPTTKRLTVPLVPSIQNNTEITNSPIQVLQNGLGAPDRLTSLAAQNDPVIGSTLMPL